MLQRCLKLTLISLIGNQRKYLRLEMQEAVENILWHYYAGTEKLLCEEQTVSREMSDIFYQTVSAEEIDRFEQYLQRILFNLEKP